jgi:hypothetical protein
MAFTTIDRTQHTAMWQAVLFSVGIIGLAAGVALEIALLVHHSTSTVTRVGRSTVTTTGSAGPTQALVTTCLGIGAVLILASAFFSRISKLVLPGGYELDLEAGAKLAGAIAAKTSEPAVAEQLYKQTAPRVAQLMAMPWPAGPGSSRLQRADLVPPDAEIARLVDATQPGSDTGDSSSSDGSV